MVRTLFTPFGSLARCLLCQSVIMKPWFLIFLIGALSGIVILRTAYAGSEDSSPKRVPAKATADTSND